MFLSLLMILCGSKGAEVDQSIFGNENHTQLKILFILNILI